MNQPISFFLLSSCSCRIAWKAPSTFRVTSTIFCRRFMTCSTLWTIHNSRSLAERPEIAQKKFSGTTWWLSAVEAISLAVRRSRPFPKQDTSEKVVIPGQYSNLVQTSVAWLLRQVWMRLGNFCDVENIRRLSYMFLPELTRLCLLVLLLFHPLRGLYLCTPSQPT